MNKIRLSIAILTLVTSTIFAQVNTVQIGRSMYDLQTNNSVERRVVVDPTTKNLTVTYTGSNKTDNSFDDRGTGYAFFNGSTWSDQTGAVLTLPVNTFPTRPESTRIGWPSPFYVGNKEMIVSHQSTGSANGLWMVSRPMRGTGAWTSNSGMTSGAETWPRVAVDGNKIVIISSEFQTSFNGVSGGIQMMRSNDGGTTWMGPDTIAGINANNYTTLSGDQYAVDLKGSTIAVLTGAYDVTLYKSTDFGNTFTKNSFVPISNNANTGNTDFVKDYASDGTYSVLVDNNNKIHCFWGMNIVYFDPNAQTPGLFIEGSKSGIMYWNENMGNAHPVVIPNTTYARELPTSPELPTSRFNTTDVTGATIGYVGSGNAYNAAICTWPSSGIDASNNIYLTYAQNRGIVDTTHHGPGIDADAKGANFYDVYMVKSTDGINWVGPLNVSSTKFGESVYPSMARYVDNNAYLVWQEDSFYGNSISTTSGGGNGTGSQVGFYTQNKMLFSTVDVTAIVNPTTDITPPVLGFKPNIEITNTFYSFTNDSLFLESYINCSQDNFSKKTIQYTKAYFLENFVEFYDNVDGRDTSKVIFSGLSSIVTNTPGNYLIKVYGYDAAGNQTKRSKVLLTNGNMVNANYYMDTLYIVVQILPASADTSSPVVTLNGDNPTYVYLNGTYTEQGATVSDNNPCSSSNYTKTGSVNTSSANTSTLTYKATDLAGNSTTQTRSVIVGREPVSVISGVTLTGNKLTASGATSLYSPTAYTWSAKLGSTTVSSSLSSSANFTNLTLSKTMDSLCLEVSNIFNTNPNVLPKSKSCVGLSYKASVQSTTHQNIKVNLYPNPTQGRVNLRFEGNSLVSNATIQVFDMAGRNVSLQQLKVNGSEEIPMDFSHLNKGTYILNSLMNNQNYSTKFEIK